MKLEDAEPVASVQYVVRMSKKDRMNEARSVINRYAINDVFSTRDTERFGLLCGYTFEKVMRVVPLKGTGASVRVICQEEQYEGPWSWVKSIGGYDQRKNLTQAMRQALRSRTFAEVVKTRCVQCGTHKRLSVDHKSIPFVAIKEKFVSGFGEPEIENIGEGWQLVDPGEFTRFHDAVADYQVLCVSCNAKKGAR